MRGQYFLPVTKAIDLTDMTPWVSYTPIFTGFGTVSNVNVRSRRIMDAVSIAGTFTVGTVTNTEARMTLGFNGISGNINALTTLPAMSYAGDTRTSAIGGISQTILMNAGQNYLTFGQTGTLVSNLIAAVATLLFVNNSTVSILASIPIEEWKAQ